MSQIVSTFVGRDDVQDVTEMTPSGFMIAFLGLSHPVFDLGEELFDRIEIGAVSRQEDQVRAARPDGRSRALAFV